MSKRNVELKPISTWEELAQLPPSDTHYLVVDLDIVGCDIYKNGGSYAHYISSHLFYGGDIAKGYERLLNRCGFNVKIMGGK